MNIAAAKILPHPQHCALSTLGILEGSAEIHRAEAAFSYFAGMSTGLKAVNLENAAANFSI